MYLPLEVAIRGLASSESALIATAFLKLFMALPPTLAALAALAVKLGLAWLEDTGKKNRRRESSPIPGNCAASPLPQKLLRKPKKHQLGTARFAAAAATATSTSTSATAAAATFAADVYRQNNDFKYCARLLRINEKLLLAFETVTACYVSRLTTKRQKLLFLFFLAVQK